MECGREFQCKNEYASLKPGYWWRWRNKTRRDRYSVFITNLLSPWPAVGEDDVQYPYPLPIPYKCPRKESCEGGLDSTCKEGYSGPLCSVCTQGYYKQLHQCKRCPSRAWIVGQLSIIAAVFFIITAVCIWTNKRKSKKDEEVLSLIDTFLSKVKIAIGFYQVTHGLLEAFSYVEWPASMRVISKYSEVLQLNVFQMTPVHCLIPGLQADAFGNLFAIMTINAAIIVFAGGVYGVNKMIIASNGSLKAEEKSLKISQIKETVYRNLFFFLYITYLSTCSKTATVLPLACRELCRDQREELCLEYLKADYSIRCHDHWYNRMVNVAYISTAYILALPTATFIALWKHRRVILGAATAEVETAKDQGSSTEIVRGMHFLYKNYKTSSWYWEPVEMSRKVIVTSGLIIAGQESRSYIGLTWVIAGMYGVVFAWTRPIQDVFENRLMTTSIAVTVFNLGVGAVSKIPEENLPNSQESYVDTFIFSILILGANTLVIGMLAGKKVTF